MESFHLGQVLGDQSLEDIALDFGHLQAFVVIHRLLEVGQDDFPSENRMVIGHVGILELGTMLQFHFQPGTKVFQGNFHALDIHFCQDYLGFLRADFGLRLFRPVAEAQFFANPLYFLNRDVFGKVALFNPF